MYAHVMRELNRINFLIKLSPYLTHEPVPVVAESEVQLIDKWCWEILALPQNNAEPENRDVVVRGRWPESFYLAVVSSAQITTHILLLFLVLRERKQASVWMVRRFLARVENKSHIIALIS